MVVGTGGEGLYKLKGSASGIAKQDDKNFGTLYCQAGSNSMACKFVSNGGSIIDQFTVT